ncbi:MAG: M23 family metallopeptidase [Bacteroidales bacterium]|nr:M23 family metallopeptidase [Bacteroidales bacterium]
MAKIKKEKRNRLRNKFRFSIFNDTSHEQVFAFRSSGLMMLISVVIAIFILIGSVTLLISLTPLREFIPGYPNAQTRHAIVQNALKADSLEQSMKLWDFHLNNIQRIVVGMEPLDHQEITASNKLIDTSSTLFAKDSTTNSDSLLRQEVLKQEQLILKAQERKINQIEGLHFFSPVKGIVSNGFNIAINHPFIDIAAPANSAVSAVLDGTVILSTWTEETGYTIQIQHSNNLISIYKHNSKLLKKSGEKVKAGTVIALVGDTGSLSSGNHLHFELWHKGVPIDPQLYINF